VDTAIISALAAVGGSSVGALTPVLSNYVIQRAVSQREIFNHQLEQRETLYSDFITSASKLFARSLSETVDQLDDLVALYAIVSRIRLVATEPVLRAAEEITHEIVEHYGDPSLDFEHIRTMLLQSNVNPLQKFSLACRHELMEIVRLGQIRRRR